MLTELKILLVGDNADDLQLLKTFLLAAKKTRFCVFNVASLAAAKKFLSNEKIDAVLLDLGLPDSTGLATFRAINAMVDVPIIIIAGLQEEEVAVTAIKEGAQDYLMKKTLTSELLSHAIIYALERKQSKNPVKGLTSMNEQQLGIQYRVALALAESTTLNHAAHGILKIICETLRWQVGEIWAMDRSINALRYVSAWFAKDTYRKIENSSHELTFSKGEGVPGYIWEIKKPYWIIDLNQDSKSTRKSLLLAKGLQSCFGFPILFQDEVMGIILFYGDSFRQPDANFLALFTGIGIQIGSFIKRKRAEGDLLYLAQHDVLTGLANRTVLENNLNSGIVHAKNYKSQMAVLYLDLDNFKKINDSVGHAKGDSILQQVGVRILESVRAVDTVARLGGDEFTILLPDVVKAKDMAAIAQKILDKIAKPFTVDGEEYHITASIGISVYPKDGHDIRTLLENADMAMYHAKVQGRNNYQFCRPDMAILTQQKMILETELHRAIQDGEFVLYYQPKINVKSGKIVGLEALIRWNRAGERIIAPNQFIPLAEETNLITPIGEWVLRTACSQIKEWHDQKVQESMTIAINISTHQFNTHFLSLVVDTLRETGLKPQFFELELSESTLMDVNKTSISVIHTLKELGIRLSVDDFGTGYSSFTYLKSFTVDAVKIDQAFIADVPDDPNANAIVLAIIAMAHTLNIKVIAEGVETKEQLDFLQRADCDEYQGFFYSKPLPAEEMYKMLCDKNKRAD